MEFLDHIFGLVCGQNPAHTWSPGGALLPLCQRCTGLYTGAFTTCVLLWICRPAVTYRFRWVHASFLIAMVPLGFHWLPQGPFLRMASGFLFGAAIMAFFSLSTAGTWTGSRRAVASYSLGLALGFVISWAAVVHGGKAAAQLISLISLAGAATVVLTFICNLAIQLKASRLRRAAIPA